LFSLVYSISPSYIFLVILGSVLTSVQVFGNVILPRYLINALLDLDTKNIIIFGSSIVVFNFLFNFIIKTYQRFLDVKNDYIQRKLTAEMGKKIMNVEYHYLEDPYYLDLKERALFASVNQSSLMNLVRSFSSIIANFFTIIGLIVIMFTLSYILILVLFVGIGITLVINALFKKYQQKFFQELLPVNRRYNYYFTLSMEPRLGKDIRLNNLSPLFLNRVNSYNLEILSRFKIYIKREGVAKGLQRVINGLQTGIVYLYISLRVLLEELGPRIRIGDFTMYISSAMSFTNNFDQLLENFMTIKQMLVYAEPLVEFMELPEVHKNNSKNKLKEIEKIEFVNLSFKYPKADNYVLKDINFSFNKGEKISIVGLNGAGKTTLIKLLCRFYKPTSGKILINNIDIFDYDYDSYINSIAAVFQDYKLFAYSIGENIASGKEVDLNKVKKIIDQVGLKDKIESLPLGLDAKLNKAYDKDGTELSGGQGQKVAIGRALYKDATLVILDEPTSALDPLAEAEIYQNFNNLVLSKTAIYISHRMSSSVFCDRVLVIDGGKVVAYDTHQNLMKNKNSLYYKLFNSQAENYQL